MSSEEIVVLLQRLKNSCLVMKKVLSFAVIVLCVVTFVKAQDIVNLRMDCQQMGLRGLVEKMDEDVLMRKDYFREDWPQRKWFIKDLRNVLQEEEGKVVTFNPAGRLVTVTYTYQGKMGKKTTCSYTSKGLLTSFTGEGYKIAARYQGNSADINVFAETKDYSSKVDIARANLKHAAFSYSYPFDLKCRQELTDDGLVLRSTYYYVDSIMARDCEYQYNHNNLLTGEKAVDYSSGEKSVSITKYTYDNKGHLVKKEVKSKAVDATFTYENNEQGDCTKMTVERPYGTTVYTFEYIYDDHSNWTVRLEYEDGVFDNATLRSFSYFKESAKKKNFSADSKKAKSSVDKKKDEKADAVDKIAVKEAKAAEKAAKKEADARQKEAAKAEKAAKKEAEKNMTKEERKAAQAAEKEKSAKEKAAEKERKSLEKAAAKEKAAAEKEAEKLAKKAEKEAKAAAKAAEKERKAAEKERKAAEKQAKKESKQ